MSLIVCGLNHRTAPVDVRERWAFSQEESRRALQHLCAVEDSEHVILSTCNRTEFYGSVPAPAPAACGPGASVDVVGFYKALRQLFASEEVGSTSLDHFYVHRDEDAVQHLFRLAAGFDSMIVGEPQILGQIKDAYTLATKAQATGRVFHRLFPAALRAGKRVRSETAIDRGCITPGQAALQLSRTALGDLESASALVIGSGEIADLTVKALSEEVAQCFVVNRTFERARGLVRRLRMGVARPWESLEELLGRVDIVVSSTASRESILQREEFARIQELRRHRPLAIVDLAVPRDFSPEIGELPGVHLFSIDSLNDVVAENVRRRHGEIPHAERIVGTAVRTFQQHLAYLDVEPVIRRLVERFEQIRLGELQKFIDQVPAEHHDVVEELSRSLAKKLLHFPIEKLKALRDLEGLSPEEVTFLRRLFLA